MIQPLKVRQIFKEKRHDVRYLIRAPACLTMDKDASKSCILFMQNISSGGALVKYTEPVSPEEKVTLHTQLPFQQKWFGRDEVEFIFHGSVIRNDEDKGQIAIQFDDDYRIRISKSD